MRTIIDLPAGQIEALDGICEREGISRAEAVRQAVARYVEASSRGQAASAFALWRGRVTDGVAYQQRLRAEWDGPRASRRRR